MIIVNADDCGASAAVTWAIRKAMEAGLCSSVSVQANGNDIEEACAALRRSTPALDVGVHLVLTEGCPLTNPISARGRLCGSDGRFRPERGRLWKVNGAEREAIRTEFRAQIAACRHNGIEIGHLDSHHHVHECPGIARIVMRIAREEGIPKVRIARNCGRSTGMIKAWYRGILNWRLRRAGLARTDYFGSWDDVEWLLARDPRAARRTIELMVHPTLNDAGVVVDAKTGRPLEEIRSLIGRYGA